MKIKKKIEAATADTPVMDELRKDQEPVMGEEEPTNKYQEAIDCITDAIACLAELGKEDTRAKESIANLAVVILDLKSEDK